MKVAFVSDTHFGYPRFEADASAQGRAAILDAARRADVLVLGGDIFDHRLPRLETILETAQVLQEAGRILRAKDPENRLRASGADGAELENPYVLGIHGTHERRAKDALNPISMLAQMGLMEDLHNRTVVVERGTPTRGAGGATGGEKRADRLGLSGMGGIPDDLVHEALGHLSCKPADEAVNFFIFHQTMREYVPVPLDELASLDDLPKGYDYYLCGHLHARREMMDGRLLIPGSTVMTQMKEEESNPKGYYLVDTSGGRAEFVPIPTRPFQVVGLRFEKAKPSEVRERIGAQIKQSLAQRRDRPILRIRLEGSLQGGMGELDLTGLEADERAVISIDNQLEGADLAAEMAALKEERLNRATPLELGMAMLRERAGSVGLKPERAQELFEAYSKEKE